MSRYHFSIESLLKARIMMSKLKLLALGILFGLILGWTPTVDKPSYTPTPIATVGVSTATVDANDLAWLSSAKESTVVVETPRGHGSGVCVSVDGLRAIVITAKHVVEGIPNDDDYRLLFASGDTDFKLQAILVRQSNLFDLAELSAFDPKHLLRPVKLGDFPMYGALVVAIGFPNDVYPSQATVGFVTGVEYMDEIPFLTHSAGIWFGNSGGPLFNRHGELVGINVWIQGYNGHAASDRGGSVTIDQIRLFIGE